jgi:DNA-binding response OmpR family regulator
MGAGNIMTNSNSADAIQAGLLLIVGQSPMSETVAQRIVSRGYNIERAASSRDAVARVSNGEVTVILLDLSSGQTTLDLADTLQGLPVCPPIIVLDSSPTIERVVDALRIGVTDYLSVSDGDAEVLDRLTGQLAKAQAAMIKPAAARRDAPIRSKESALGTGSSGLPGLDLNSARRMLVIEDVPILLSSIELNLIEALIQRAPNLVTYEEMARIAFPNTQDVEHALRLLRPHIARLRRKFESVHNTRWRISNFRGQGYVLQRIGAPIGMNNVRPIDDGDDDDLM